MVITGVINCHCAGSAGDYTTVVGWDSRGSALIRPCIELNRYSGRFRVIQAGLYIVVSRLAFMGPTSDPAVPRIYGQKVVLDKISQTVVAEMQLRSTADLPLSSAPVHTSIAVGVFRFRANELLRVDAKPADQLARGNQYSSFSLVKLQSG